MKNNEPIKEEEIIYLEDEEFTDKLVYQYGYNRLKARLIGGFCFPVTKLIYIRESRRYDEKLLKHERGHVRGKFGHTWFPSIMFPSWIGRIFNTYWPYRREK
jgi:hypothetical protein